MKESFSEKMASGAKNDEVKQKILNTITQYKQQCASLDNEVATLKTSIAKLCHVASGLNEDIDEELVLLQDQAISGGSVEAIQLRINNVANLLMTNGTTKSIHKVTLKDHLQQLFGSIENIELTSLHKQQYQQLKQLVDSNQDDDLVLECLNTLLSGLLANLNDTIKFHQQNHSKKKSIWGKEKTEEQQIQPRVTQSLQELISHLMTSSSLDDKASELSRYLDEPLTYAQLGQVVDSLTELVILAYNQEQTKLKNFLREFSTHLIKMESFLAENQDDHVKSYQHTKAFEQGIQQNIADISMSIEEASSIEDLVGSVNKNIHAISESVMEFKQEAKNRLMQSEQRAEKLRHRLIQAETETASLKASVTYHESRANLDRLTNLPNREAYEKHFKEAFQRWKRSKQTMSISVCDIDYFKNINDSYGHLAGDKVLKKVASLIKNNIREVDFVGRYGGEEFVLIFENTPQEHVANVLDKIRKQIEGCEFHCKEKRVSITMSFGFTIIRKEDNLDTAFHRADEALYRAKNGGRNQVVAG